MKKIKIVFITGAVLFSSHTHAGHFKSSIGFGVQYGLSGYQLSYLSAGGKARAGIGPAGVTIGYDFHVNQKISFGLQAFNIVGANGAGINLNYHFPSNHELGWLTGFDAFKSNEKETPSALISFGYML